MKPTEQIASAKSSHRTLMGTLDSLTDAQARRPSLLPEWTVGHVIAHLARNADGLSNMFAGAARGEVWEMYPGGIARRAQDIEAGSSGSANDLRHDVASAIDRLETHWDGATEEMWATGRGLAVVGDALLRDLVFRRWNETEIHHHDLGLAYRFDDWPDDYVAAALERTVAQLGQRLGDTAIALRSTDSPHVWTVPETACSVVEVRAPRRQLLAWLVGRYEDPYYPTLKPW